MKKLFNKARIDETAEFIALELKTILNRGDIHSYMSRRIIDALPAYRNGLTNCERELATLRALSMAQMAIAAPQAIDERVADAG